MSVKARAVEKRPPLSRSLEEEPLEKRRLVLLTGDGQPLFLVIALDKVEQNGVRLPNDEVAVSVIDNGGDASVGVVLRVLRCFVLVFVEVKEFALVSQPELLEDKSDFPVTITRQRTVSAA